MASAGLSIDRNVFVNCPIDPEYKDKLNALIFTIYDCGFYPRYAEEASDSGEPRFAKICRLIRESRYGIHDLSRIEINSPNLPRFNMPLELGLFIGSNVFSENKTKACLVMDAEQFRYQRFCSDISGVDISAHLKPNLPEAHLTAAFHLYICYRDYQRARVHITIATEALPNSAEAFALDGYLDRRQGHWAESTRALERAIKLDPKNPEILNQLGANYEYLRQYRDNERIADRLIALEPEEPILKVRTEISLDEKGDLTGMRANLETLRSTMKDSEQIFWSLFEVLVYSRDWTSAKELVKSRSMEEIPFGFGYDSPMVPRVCVEIQIAKYQGEHPEMDPEFLAGRNQLLQKVDANPEDPKLLAVLGLIEAYLGRKQEAIQQAKRAVEMLPVSKDAVDAPALVESLAAVCALTNEPDLAFQLLDVSVKTPGGVTYGNLKLNPDWDSLRSDPRFDRVLAQLTPKK